MPSWLFLLILSLLLWGSLSPQVFARAQLRAAASGGGPASAQEGPHLAVNFRGNRLSVQARNTPWPVVLQELERRIGIALLIKAPLYGTLTEEFETLTVEQGLRRLFRNTNLVLFYTEGSGEGPKAEKLTRVWVLPKDDSRPEPAQVPSDGSMHAAAGPKGKHDTAARAVEAIPPDGEPKVDEELTADEPEPTERLEELDALARQDDTEALQRALLDPNDTIRARALELLEERDSQGTTAMLAHMSKSDEPETRFQAISLLDRAGRADERAVVSTLGTALTDDDLKVQSYAIEALANHGGSEALEYLRQAYRNSEPAIRMIMIDSVVPVGEGLPLLREALGDTDEEVRSLAAFRLRQVGLTGE